MSRLLRWWWLTIPGALLLLAGCLLLAVKAKGAMELAEVQTALRAAGKPVTYEDWLSTLAPIDGDAAKALRQAVKEVPFKDIRSLLATSLKPVPPMSETSATAARRAALKKAVAERDLLIALDAQRGKAIRVQFLLGRPGATLSTRDLLPKTSSVMAELLVRAPSIVGNLQATWEIAGCFQTMAMLDLEREAALVALRRLTHASQDGEFIVDAMIGVAVQRICDDTHLDLLLDGRLSATTARIWIGEALTPQALLARAWAGERCGYGVFFSHVNMFGLSPIGTDPGLWLKIRSWVKSPWGWAIGEGESARYQAALLAIEQASGSGSTVAAMPGGVSWLDQTLHPMSAPMSSNLFQATITMLEADAQSRSARAIAILYLGAIGQPDSSSTQAAAAIGPLLDQGPNRFRLGMESLGGRRVRVALDVSTAQPSTLDLSRYRRDRCIGGPAGRVREPGKSDREGIEIDLPR